MRSFAAVLLGLALLAASAEASAAAVVSGIVVLAPANPVCRPGQPCTKPLAGFKLTFWHHGAVAARVVTGRRGRYRTTLAPGVYFVTTPSRGQPGLRPRRVTVSKTARVTLNFRFDAGIR